MFREIRTREKIETIKKESKKGYLQIKPEKELSKKELDNEIMAIFALAASEVM